MDNKRITEEDTLKKDMIFERGIVTLNKNDNEDAIQEKLKSALQNKYSMIIYPLCK
jgi:hypothetical protein